MSENAIFWGFVSSFGTIGALILIMGFCAYLAFRNVK